MGLSRLVFICCLWLELSAGSPSIYLAQTGKTTEAIQSYLNEYNRTKKHDFELLQQIGLAILDHGFYDKKPEVKLMSLLGAALSNHESAFYLLERGSDHWIPEIQLISLQLMAQTDTQETDSALARMVRSNYLPIRFEAVHQLARRKHEKAFAQIEALMSKVPNELLPLFPILYGIEGSHQSTRALHRLMGNPSESVRIAAIITAAESKKDELLPPIQALAKQVTPGQLEACAFALGEYGSDKNLPLIRTLAASQCPEVRLAGLKTLYKMGQKEAAKEIIEMARAENLYAIYALEAVEESIDLLCELVESKDPLVRIAAGLSLLEHHHPKSLTALPLLLINDHRDFGFEQSYSPGRTAYFWKLIPSARSRYEKDPLPFEVSLVLRESILTKALELPPESFITLAELIFKTQQDELVPVLVRLLENMQSDKSIALLKKHQQKVGAPLIRQYCTLALYRLNQEGPYAEQLKNWVTKEQRHELIQLRPMLTLENAQGNTKYDITPHETSRLLIETLETYAAKQNEESVAILLETMLNGNKANQYALAGFLIRTVQ